MLFHITSLLAVTATLLGLASANDKPKDPNNNCGAPFCARGLRPDFYACMAARATESAASAVAAPMDTTTPGSPPA